MNPETTSEARLPTFYIPHGGGPCFFMDWPGNPRLWDSMATFLRGIRGTVAVRPRAIVVISAHWEAREATVTSNSEPDLLFDYYGFPKHTYELEYPAPGEPAVAARVRNLLRSKGIESRDDRERGFDHGVFIPFLLVEPEASIPIVQLSLVAGLEPARHIAIGEALAPLRDEGVLIVGSGMSYHNVPGLAERAPGSETFDAWLSQTALADAATRSGRLRDWQLAPDARRAHPREEHLLPLMVAAGAAGDDAGSRVFGERVGNAVISAYRFG
jgi:aromatic ring-opening dioxygenase catalytic subunit (LigB family)